MALLVIEAARAKRRMAEGGAKAAPRRPATKGGANLPALSKRRARDAVARSVGQKPRAEQAAAVGVYVSMFLIPVLRIPDVARQEPLPQR
jgi:hypothetical protein